MFVDPPVGSSSAEDARKTLIIILTENQGCGNVEPDLPCQLILTEFSHPCRLTASGRIFSSGFGPTGRRGHSALHHIEGLPSIASLSVSLDSVMAQSSDGRRVFVWGLDANGGSLGLGSWERDAGGSGASPVPAAGSPDTQAQEAGGGEQEEGEEWQEQDIVRRVRRPVELDLGRWLGDRGHVESICCGGEASFVVIEDGEEPRGIWQPRGGLVRM